MTTTDSLLARVRKLLAQAEDPSVTPGEAEAFNTKAAELIARHGIDEALLAADNQQCDHITRVTITIDSPYSHQKAELLSWIAQPLRCNTIHYSDGRVVEKVIVFGFRSDLDRVELLYTSLLLQATNQLIRVRGTGSIAAYRRSWLRGFAVAVYRRLLAAEKQAADEARDRTTTAGTSTALVLRDRATQVEEAYRQEFPNVRPGRVGQLSGSGYHDGHAAGKRADLGASRLSSTRTAISR